MPENPFAGSQFPYYRYGQYLRERFSQKVHKVSVDAGFSCPNRDDSHGCLWCDNSSFNPNRRNRMRSVTEQVELGVRLLRQKMGCEKFIAYFQAYTNTYAGVDELERLYREALSVDGVIGLAIGTRPDCIDKQKLDLLQSLAQEHYIQLEYGLQTANDQTLQRMNRGHLSADFVRAMELSCGRGLDLCGHMIIGLPGDCREDYTATLKMLVECGVSGVKFHNLHIVRGSGLADEYLREKFALLEADEYIEILTDLLEILPAHINVQRLWGAAGSKDLHIAPDWCLDHNLLTSKLCAEFKRRGSWQGCRVG